MTLPTLAAPGGDRFAVQLQLHRGLSTAEIDAFGERIRARLLRWKHCPVGLETNFFVQADREMSPSDQVWLLLATLDDPAIRQIYVGSLYYENQTVRRFIASLLWLQVDPKDPLVDAARKLYQAERLDARGFIEALGSFTCPAVGALDFAS